MKISVYQFGKPWYALASSSLIKGLKNAYPNSEIFWITSSENFPLFQYNNNLKDVYVGEFSFKDRCDLAINLYPTLSSCMSLDSLDAKNKTGFILENGNITVSSSSSLNILEIIKGKEKTSRNVFQVIYDLAGLKWGGEGYDLCYYPKNKMKKNKTGIAISDDNLRHFIKNNLKLELSELWHVPIKKNILKSIDEINRVKRIITNDVFCLHSSIALKKHVEFVDNEGYNMSVEFFGNGNHYRI